MPTSTSTAVVAPAFQKQPLLEEGLATYRAASTPSSRSSQTSRRKNLSLYASEAGRPEEATIRSEASVAVI